MRRAIFTTARGGAGLARSWGALTIRKFLQDNGLFLASGLAFTLLLYAIPLALIMISVLGYTVLDSARAMGEVHAAIRRFLPRSEAAFAENVASIVAARGLLGFAGFVMFAAFSTTVFGAIRHILNVVFRVARPRGFVGGTVRDLLTMLFCVLLLVFAVGFGSMLAVIGTLGPHVPWAGSLWGRGLQLLETVMALVLAAGLLFGLYRLSPAQTLRDRSLLVGSVVGVSLFELAKGVFAWYVQFAQASVALYGALGGLVLFFFWLYYASVVFILGAEAAWAWEHVRAAGPSGPRRVRAREAIG